MGLVKTIIKKSLLSILVLVVLGVGLLLITGHGYILTAISRTYLAGQVTANIDDYRQFNTTTIEAGTAQPWPKHSLYNSQPLPDALEKYVLADDTVAFLVIKDGQLLAENYYKGYDQNSKTNSFSMTKTFISLMLDIAISEGYIESLDQPLIDILPEFADDPLGKTATIGQLSSMTSGYDWDEAYYSPFSPTVELVYGDDVERLILNRGFRSEPGTEYYYSSASTQLLALLIRRALQAKDPDASLTGYFSEKLWKPLGADADAFWHTDDQGLELGFCCVSSNARNFAKFGQLLLNDGKWNAQQLIKPEFVNTMRSPFADPRYGYSVWINQSSNPPSYQLKGHLGQNVIVVPEENMIIVRLGQRRAKQGQTQDAITAFYIEQSLKLLE